MRTIFQAKSSELPACPWHCAGSTRGFTLLELMVVLALIGILSVMIIPEMRRTFENALLRSQARELINVFHIAHSRAVSMNQAHRVRIDVVGGYYFVETEAPETGGEFMPLDLSGATGQLDRRILVAIENPGFATEDQPPPSDPLMNDGNPVEQLDVITFYPDGTAQKRMIHLMDREGFQLALQINPVTSRVRIMEMERQ